MTTSPWWRPSIQAELSWTRMQTWTSGNPSQQAELQRTQATCRMRMTRATQTSRR